MRASNSSVAPRVRARESATAPAGSAAISRAAFKPSVSTSSGATTMLAMPNSLACVALSGCPMTRNSNARRWPIRRGASRLEAASGIRPRLTNGVEKNASEPATTKSQWNSIVVPTPTATPLTAATIGLLQRTSVGRKSSAGRLRPPELSAALRKSARSLPAENAPGTPAISTQRTESSAFAPSSAAVIASYMASVSAFFLSGRFIRMVRMPSASVTITCSVIKCIRFPRCRPQPRSRSRSAAALERRLGEGAEASYGFSYDQRVHFARAFIGIDSFGVSNEATDMVLEQDAVAAEQFARIADSLAAFHRGEGFRQRRMLVFHQSLVLQLAQPQHHRLAGGDVAEHAHEQVLDKLETADRLAELNPLVRVAQRVLVGAHLAAHREPRHPSARHPQDLPAVLERVGGLQAVRLGHAAILQRDEPVLHHA